MKKKSLIFLTGCINPNGMIFTKLQDQIARRKHYIDSIKFYLLKTSNPILFVENSGVDISEEFKMEIDTGRLEILTFDGNNYDKSLGKGLGEMMIMKHAIKHSKFFEISEVVLKITGRYKILNIEKFLKNSEVVQNFVSIDIIRSFSIAESKFFICQKNFIEDFLIKYEFALNDSIGFYFEHALLNASFDAFKENYKFTTLPEYPRFSGIFGSDNIPFNESYVHWLKCNLRFKLKNYLIQT